MLGSPRSPSHRNWHDPFVSVEHTASCRCVNAVRHSTTRSAIFDPAAFCARACCQCRRRHRSSGNRTWCACGAGRCRRMNGDCCETERWLGQCAGTSLADRSLHPRATAEATIFPSRSAWAKTAQSACGSGPPAKHPRHGVRPKRIARARRQSPAVGTDRARHGLRYLRDRRLGRHHRFAEDAAHGHGMTIVGDGVRDYADAR